MIGARATPMETVATRAVHGMLQGRFVAKNAEEKVLSPLLSGVIPRHQSIAEIAERQAGQG